jgi:hypothetical protein
MGAKKGATELQHNSVGDLVSQAMICLALVVGAFANLSGFSGIVYLET